MLDMELYHQIIAEYLARSGAIDVHIDADHIIEGVCYQALCQIRDILTDTTLSDPECFDRIEKIVCVLEELGSDAGSRHDFG